MYFLPQRIVQSHHTFLFVLKSNQAWCFVLVAATPAWGAMCTSWADGHGRAGGGWIRQGDARRSRWGLLCARQRLTWSVKVEDAASPCPVDLCRRNLHLLSGHSVVSLPWWEQPASLGPPLAMSPTASPVSPIMDLTPTCPPPLWAPLLPGSQQRNAPVTAVLEDGTVWRYQ